MTEDVTPLMDGVLMKLRRPGEDLVGTAAAC